MAWRTVRYFLVWLLLGLLMGASARADVQELRQATAFTTVDGSSESSTVSLPYNWDRQHSGRVGSATFEVAFSLTNTPDTPYAVYIQRIGNAYEVWLNGMLLQRNGDLAQPNGADYAKAPRYIELPMQLLQSDNLFRIVIRADSGRHSGLAPLLVGPDNEIRKYYEEDYRWQVAASLTVVVLSLLVGVAALMLWLTQADPTQLCLLYTSPSPRD